MMRKIIIPLTVDAVGAGTALSRIPITGEIVSVRLVGTALGGTADFTLTRPADGGTILAISNAQGPWQYQPRDTLHTLTGGSALGAGDTGVAIDDYVRCVVAQAQPSATASVHVYYRE